MNEERQISITIDVWCRDGDEWYSPAYRIFVDGDLLAERSFHWKSRDTYVRENIFVNLSPGRHYLKVDKIGDVRDHIKIENITVDGAPADFEFSV